MDFWIILYIIDWILFIPVAGTVLYLGIFSVASLFTRESVLDMSENGDLVEWLNQKFFFQLIQMV